MKQKISDFSLKAYFSFKGFVDNLKNDERGLSGVVVAVLLILVAVLAVVVLNTGLKTWLAQLWTKITTAGDGIS